MRVQLESNWGGKPLSWPFLWPWSQTLALRARYSRAQAFIEVLVARLNLNSWVGSFSYNSRSSMYRIIGLLFVVLPYCILSSEANYNSQGTWGGQCNNADSKRQSPIDIPCKDFIQICPSNITYKVHWENPTGMFGGSTSSDLHTVFVGNSWVQFTNSTNSYLFKSAQFHLHSPS